MIKKIGGYILIALAVLAFMKWSDTHDQQVEVAAQAYARCVQNEYGVTPAEWYNEHGNYPECSDKPSHIGDSWSNL